ncbi:MAG: B12-binding domain-containing radical SAM protein [Flavobacteriales bacterium]|nr:B12-binding domain-containing radical SAM protein [Flavobacteriales bacterium]
MARVLFAHSYFYRLDAKQWADGRPYPPLGTLLAAAVLREAGHQVTVFDTGLRHSPDELVAELDRVKPDILVLYDDGFNYLTKMCLTVMRDAAFRMIAHGRAAGCRIAVNSSDASDHSTGYLNAGADVVILGEGEPSLVDVVQRWEKGIGIEDVPGIAVINEGRVTTTARRTVLRDLDALPLPAWDLIDVAPYQEIWRRSQGSISLNMATTRGCPFKCNWCAKPIYGNRYNSRSPEHVVSELELLHTRYAADHIWFADDIFGLKPGWVQRFRDVLAERGLKIRYKIQSRVDLLLESDTIDALVASGLEEVWVGAESGSQRILDAMDKGTRVEQIAEATRLLRSKGVRVCFFLQFGYLGETEVDVERTIRMVEDLMPDDIGVSISYPLPGTVFHEKVKADLQGKSNWSDSDDLAMMFRNRQRPAYYKRLHRYVHKRYRRKQALNALRDAFPGSPTALLRMVSALYYVPATFLERMRLIRLADA